MTELQTYIDGLPPSELALLVSFAILLQALKGFALWTAAQRSENFWFMALLFLNTLGILELVYLFIFSKRESNEKVESE